MDIQSKPNRSFELDNPIKFTYPILIRIILGIGGPAFLVAAVYTSPLVREQDLALWVPLLFLIVGLMSVLLVYIFSGQIVIDSYSVSFQRLSKKFIIPFDEVLKIEHRDASDRLVIHGENGKIIVEKFLKDYTLFYSMLDRLCPNKENEARLSFPIHIHSRLWLPVFSVVIILVGFGNLYYAFRYAYIPVGILGMLGAVIGAGFFIYIPRRYIFDVSGLTVNSLIRENFYPTEDLLSLRLNRVSDHNTYGAEYSLLQLNFKNGKVTLRDLNVDFPLEVLEKILHERYPRSNFNSGFYPNDAGIFRIWWRTLEVNKNPRSNLAALIAAAVVFLAISCLLFLAKDESQFIALTSELSTVEHYPNPGPRYMLSTGLHAASDPLHEWNRTSYGLFWHWLVTDVAGDDPLEYYREIDLAVFTIYAILALGSAAASWLATYVMVKLWKKRNR